MRMAKKKSSRFNPKKEVSVMGWIEDDQGSVLLVRQVVVFWFSVNDFFELGG